MQVSDRGGADLFELTGAFSGTTSPGGSSPGSFTTDISLLGSLDAGVLAQGGQFSVAGELTVLDDGRSTLQSSGMLTIAGAVLRLTGQTSSSPGAGGGSGHVVVAGKLPMTGQLRIDGALPGPGLHGVVLGQLALSGELVLVGQLMLQGQLVITDHLWLRLVKEGGGGEGTATATRARGQFTLNGQLAVLPGS